MPAVKPAQPKLDRSHPIAKGLVSCWVLNEAGGLTANDIGPRGNDGTLTGTGATVPTWEDGPNGTRLSADSNQNYVTMAYNFSELGRLGTFVVYCEPQGGALDDLIADWNTSVGFSLRLETTNSMTAFVYPGNYRVSSAGSFTTGDQVLFGVTLEHSTLRCWMHGKSVGTATLSGGIGSSAATGKLMARGDLAGGQFWAGGYMSLAAIWDRPLTAQEMERLYDDPFVFVRPPRRGYYGVEAAAVATVESRILHSAMAGSSVGPGSSFVHAGAGRAATY